MNHYLLAVLGSSAPLLSYASPHALVTGLVVTISLKGRKAQGVVIQPIEPPEDFTCKEVGDSLGSFLPLQQTTASFIASYYLTSLGESFGIFTPLRHTLPSLPVEVSAHLATLSPLQEEALGFILSRPRSLLFGDTGSGKTEIYAHLIHHHLKQGQNTLLLMPEISLTPQMEKRLRNYFGDSIALWHSKISPAKKRKILAALEKGEIRIVAGARSALFLPIQHLGLIIVDEEHDDAYKANDRPRYNARDLALFMGDRGKIRVVLGSATPAATTYARFMEQDAIFRLRGGHFQSQKRIQFISGLDTLTPSVVESIQQTLQNNKQAILFLPTRANFKHLLCTACGESVQCPHCSVSLSLHKKNNALLCHHCRHTQPIPSSCPSCSSELHSLRMGTAQIAEELQAHFPTARIARFDRDVITTDKQLKETLESFNEGEIDILVGTQMISKGHDYHGVQLVAILGIDYLLKSDDYRARERALSLLLQLAGRSGRKERGEVIIQTLHADFFRAHLKDYALFLEEELTLRKELYPPFVKLAILWFSHKDQAKALESYREVLKNLEHHAVDIVAHGAAPIERIAQKWRYHILLRDKSSKKLLNTIAKSQNTLTEIDIDPLSFV